MDSPDIRLLRFRDVVKTALAETESVKETETKEDHYRVIRMTYNQLLNSMTSVGDIVAKLFQTGHLTDLERESIQSFESTPIRASAELLNIIMRKSSNVYDNFLTTLKNANQKDAYLLLTNTKPGQLLINSDHYCLIRQHYDWLTRNIACDAGLTARLFEKGVLTIRELEYIGSKTDMFRKNETFLFTISRKSSEDFATFQQALIETGQIAVVDRLKCTPTNESRQHDESDEHRFLIQRNFGLLAETIEPNYGLIQLLFEKEVITNREREAINAEKNTIKTNEALLKVISQKSTADFEQFKNALTKTKQDHVIRKLMEERPKTTVQSRPTEKTSTIQIADKQVSDRKKPKPSVPPKPGKQDDGSKGLLKANVPPKEHPPKEPTRKIRSFRLLKSNFEKLENTLQREISLKVTTYRQESPNTSQNVFQLCLQTIAGEWHDIRKMERQQKAEQMAMIHEREIEKEKLNSELHALKRTLTKEERLRRLSEDQNNKTNEMYERMKKEFQQQGRRFEEENGSLRTENDALIGLLNNEKLQREKVVEDLQEERKIVEELANQLEEAEHQIQQHRNNTSPKLPEESLSLHVHELKKELLQTLSDLDLMKEENHDLEIAIEKYKSDVTTADNRSSHLEENLNLFTHQLHSFSTSTNNFLSLEMKRLDIAMEKIMDLEKKVTFVAGKIMSMGDASSRDFDRRTQEINEHEEAEKKRIIENMERENKRLIEKCKKLEMTLENFELRFYSTDNDTRTPSLIHELKAEATLMGKETIQALAVLEKELFLLYYNVAEIEVYDTMSYQIVRRLQIPNMSKPWDMTSGEVDKCLFVLAFDAQYRAMSIIIKINAHGELIDPWPKPTGGVTGNISIHETNVIVCLWQQSIINEFSQNGEIIRRVKLSSVGGNTNPFHAIKVSSMHYAVSFGHTKEDPVKICIIDFDGNVRRECTKWDQRRRQGGIKELFRSDKRSESGIVTNGLIHFVEDNKGSLFVADVGNNKIFLLSSTLEYKRTLIQFSDEELLSIFCFDETKNTLVVATNIFSAKGVFKSSRVLIYNV